MNKPMRSPKNLLLACVLGTLPFSAALASEVQPNAPYDVDSDFLAEACTVIGQTAYGKIPYFDCYSYFYGVMDSYHSLAAILLDAQRICLPEKLTPKEAYDIYWQWFEKHPEQDQLRASEAILRALREKYPCKH